MTQRALVTGAGGFVGRWLCQLLVESGWHVTGASPDPAPVLDAYAGVEWLPMDIRQQGDVVAALDASRPDAIFHLAGVTFLPGAQSDPGLAVDVNVGGTARLLADVRRRRKAGTSDPFVLIVGSAEQYGRHDASELPLVESAEQRPLNVYAATKSAQEIIAREAHRSDGVRVVMTRSFNHSGAGQSPQFLLPALVQRALGLRESKEGKLRIGNTSPIRDYLHVADVVRAYALLAERGVPGEVYNVCSGVGTSVGELTQRVLDRAGVAAELWADPALVRPADVPALVGNPGKLRDATGWKPTMGIDNVIDDLVHAATH
jgi:GDP-4-dehydro-6-deoxy-D-mannose reductase